MANAIINSVFLRFLLGTPKQIKQKKTVNNFFISLKNIPHYNLKRFI